MDKLLDNNYRIQYYLKNSCSGNNSFFKRNIKNGDFINLYDKKGDNNYSNDLLKIIQKNNLKKDKEIKYCPRDRVELFFDAPTIVKSRLISNEYHYSILMKLNISRHFRDIQEVKKYDIPFYKKKNGLIWRGTTTGYGFGNFIPERPTSRETLIKKYCNLESLEKKIDIGLSSLVQNGKKNERLYKDFLRPRKTIQEQLQYKYILSVEGNDVATNLKWILYSNSVLFMSKPCIESWIMESHLKPYIHYIPVADNFSDIEEKMNWCNKNQKECLKIIKNSKDYIKLFLNEKNENKIMKEVLKKYIENIYFC